MALNQAQKGQRRRRRNEAQNTGDTKAVKAKKIKSKKPKKQLMTKTVIEIPDSDDSGIQCLPGSDDSDIECVNNSRARDEDNGIESSNFQGGNIAELDSTQMTNTDPAVPISNVDSEEVQTESIGQTANTSFPPSDQTKFIGIPNSDEDDTFDLYDQEMEERNQANNLVQYMEAAIQDYTSDEEAEEIADDPLQMMWSIFYHGPLSYVDPKPRGHVLKTGKTNYSHPVASSNPSSKKLVT
jgi:hypothetical protein